MVREGDPLDELIIESLEVEGITLQDGDILVLAQKIVSKAEGRMVNLASITPSEGAKTVAVQTEKDPRLVELILRESRDVMRTRPGTIIVEHRLGFVCANAGIDQSNIQALDGNQGEWVLLLPENPDASAHKIRQELETHAGVRLGILIIDSHGRAWRQGVVGITIGLSGLPALVDMRGKPDMYGYILRVTQIGVADELAAAASLVMGEAAEKTPAVHVRGFQYPLRESSFTELIRVKDQDLFR
jgi:coenzyme F420-0:L-glutamate ligase/coenzyme F420-1:gamma-L-glutamate ligase